MPRRFWLAALLLSLFPRIAASGDEVRAVDPYWSLIHDQAVIDDLKLTADQRKAWRALLDPLDVRCFPLRNKSATEAEAGFGKAAADAKTELSKLITPRQAERLQQIIVRAQGTAALLRDDLAAKLKLTDKQRSDVKKVVVEARDARAKLENELRAAKLETAAAEKQLAKISTDESSAVNAIVTNDQKIKLNGLFAHDFDVSKLGNTAFKTPDLIGDSTAWLNSPPLAPDQLRGRVVVVHSFAFGCINCIHNYPVYREWQEALKGKDVQLIGVHTPETQAEHNVQTLKGKLKTERLEFPVIVDNDKANWNAWGNSMWPSVYVIDKQGYMRAFWAGELKWQGAAGDQQIKRQIEALLAE